MADGTRHLNAIALEASEVCVIHMQDLNDLTLPHPQLQSEIRRILSRKLIQAQHHLLTLGILGAEEKLSGFLLNLSLRLYMRGHQYNDFDLQMSRSDIASYLGIKNSTLSRLLAQF